MSTRQQKVVFRRIWKANAAATRQTLGPVSMIERFNPDDRSSAKGGRSGRGLNLAQGDDMARSPTKREQEEEEGEEEEEAGCRVQRLFSRDAA